MANYYKELTKRFIEAKEIIRDEYARERFMRDMEEKLKQVPIIGNDLADILVLFSMVKSYFKREYVTLPVGSLIAIIAALLYFISGLDVIPDAIPFLGFFDDISVIKIAMKMVKDDVRKYREWQESIGKKDPYLIIDADIEVIETDQEEIDLLQEQLDQLNKEYNEDIEEN